ncbi:MAG: HAD family phosphatase [Ignavibacteria bacterium]|jgi:putative hydrolase of the HAD superfamily|nr:HAD family phosphatase [Ignavibacteria bacterium]
MDLTNIKNIAFDLGGIIITLDHIAAISRFREIGLNWADQFLNPYHQQGIFRELEEGRLTQEQFAEEVSKDAGKTITTQQISYAMMGFVKEMPLYKLDLLEDLRRRGFNLYLLSNTNPILMDWAFSDTFTEYGKGIDKYFDKLYLSYLIGYTKPSPEIFQYMLKDSGVVPTETLFIDDSEANIEMGKQIGFHTYLAGNGEDFRHIFN